MVWVRGNDPGGGCLAVGPAQGQTVLDIQLDGRKESRGVVALEKLDLDGLVAPANGRMEPVHAVDDLHALTVHEYRRQRTFTLSQQLDVLGNLAREPGRIAWYQ